MAAKLKDCPLCGAKALFTTRCNHGVQCSNDLCACNVDGYARKRDAISTWNRRQDTKEAGRTVRAKRPVQQPLNAIALPNVTDFVLIADSIGIDCSTANRLYNAVVAQQH